MVKKENEVFVTYDRSIMENSIDIKAFSNGFTMKISSEVMEYMEKILESQQNSINNQLGNLSLVYFRIVSSIKFLKENLKNISEYWEKIRNDYKFADTSNGKVMSVDYFEFFSNLNMSDLENILEIVLDVTKAKIEDLNNTYIILNKIKKIYLKSYKGENEESNENIYWDSLSDVNRNDVLKIDVIKELVDYLPSNPIDLSVNDIISKAEGMLFDFNMITFSFYMEIIDRYKTVC